MMPCRGKIPLFHPPTPLEYLENISADLGIKLYIKRDDMTGLGGGGNKLRKLEYLLYDAINSQCTALITSGGIQTNHGRLTAAVAAKFGLKCAIVCVDGNAPEVLAGNLLLDRLMGAEVVIKRDDGREMQEQLCEAIGFVKQQYELNGEKVYVIPTGGSTTLGALGYMECAEEIAHQVKAVGHESAEIICAVGSLGTYMGLFCGLKSIDYPANLIGISIMPWPENGLANVLHFFDEIKKEYGLPFSANMQEFHIETGYARGGYNNSSQEIRDAVKYMARREGIILDPCYTGKAFAGLLQMLKEGKIERDTPIVFLHTGGLPGLYAEHHVKEFSRELMSGVKVL